MMLMSISAAPSHASLPEKQAVCARGKQEAKGQRNNGGRKGWRKQMDEGRCTKIFLKNGNGDSNWTRLENNFFLLEWIINE